MAGKTITIRLALEGGKEVQGQFQAIGKDGEEAFKKIQDAAGAQETVDKVAPALDNVKEKVKDLSAETTKVGAAWKDFASNLASTVGMFAALGTAVAGLAGGFALLVKNAADAADNVLKTAESIGITTKELQNLQFAAGQSGVGSESLTKNLTRLNRSMGEVGKGAVEYDKKQRELTAKFNEGKLSVSDYNVELIKLNSQTRESGGALSRLGIAVVNADGSLRNTHDVLLELADVFKAMPNGAQKSALALEIFGRSGARMVPFLNEGADGIARLEKEAERVAPAFTELQLQVGRDLNDAFDGLGQAISSARNAALLSFAPLLTKIVNGLTEFIARNREAFVSFAQAVAEKVKPVIEDIVAILEGRAQDVQNSFIIKTLVAIGSFAINVGRAIGSVLIPVLEGWLIILDQLAAALNAVFGTQIFSGTEIAIAAAVIKFTNLFGTILSGIRLVTASIGLLTAAFGAWPIILAVIGVAFGAFLFNLLGGIDGIKQKWEEAWIFIQNVVAASIEVINGLFAGFTEGTAAIWNAIVTVAQAAWQTIVDGFKFAVDSIIGFFTGLWEKITKTFEDIIEKAKKVAKAVKEAFSGGSTASGTADASVQAAGGGHIRGPGTATSDSIFARLSDGEFVERTKAVRHYGVDFMHALNRLAIPRDSIRALMGGVNLSGLANSISSSLRPRYAFADGGMAIAGGGGSLSPVNININGATIPAMMTGDSLNSLRKHSVASQMRAMGRTPTWFKG